MVTKIQHYLFLVLTLSIVSCTSENQENRIDPLIDYKSGYDDFLNLATQLQEIRNNRLIDLDQFLELQNEANTIILDSRSKELFTRKHLEGAINLPFTEYTQNNWRKIIPDLSTRILIYCNNNFTGDDVNFGSKRYVPNYNNREILSKKRPILLALNIPTFITLHGYGYENVYELSEVVDINDRRLWFEETPAKIRFAKLDEITIRAKRIKGSD